jgi:hypothetical protein
MIKNLAKLTDVTVLNTGTNSRGVVGVYEYNDAEEITIYAPAVLPEAGTIQVCEDPLIAAPNWVTLQIAGVDATPPAAGKAKSFGSELAGTAGFRIVLAAVAADRTFKVTKHWST